MGPLDRPVAGDVLAVAQRPLDLTLLFSEGLKEPSQEPRAFGLRALRVLIEKAMLAVWLL